MENVTKPLASHRPALSAATELAWLLGGLILFFLLNFATAEKNPTVWCDEVMYTDPAVNLFQGHGFTSGAWFLQTNDKFWAGNVPCYQIVLYGWLKLFGFSLPAVRSVHYVLFAAAILVAWLAIRRLNLIASPAHRLVFCLITALCTASLFAYRFVRPESLGILFVAFALLAASLRPRPLALSMLAVSGMLLTATGLQLTAYVCLMSGLLWLCGPRQFRLETVALCAGCALGGLGLYLFYKYHGVWNDFVVCIRHHTIANQGTSFPNTNPYGALSDKIKHLPQLFADYSLAPMLALAGWMLWDLSHAKLLRRNSPLVFGVIACVAVPLGLYAVGIFPKYYFWMAFFPLALGCCAELGSWLQLHSCRHSRRCLVALIALACLLGLPRRLAVASFEWRARSYEPLMQLAEPYVSRDKLVACDFYAYYAAKQHAATLILPNYLHLLTDAAKARVSVVIFRDGTDTASLAGLFGGEWRDTGAVLHPDHSSPFHENLDSRQYNLRVFVRETIGSQ